MSLKVSVVALGLLLAAVGGVIVVVRSGSAGAWRRGQRAVNIDPQLFSK